MAQFQSLQQPKSQNSTEFGSDDLQHYSAFTGIEPSRPAALDVNVRCLTQTVYQGLAFIYTFEITALFLCAGGSARRNTTETAGVTWITVSSPSQPPPEVNRLPEDLQE